MSTAENKIATLAPDPVEAVRPRETSLVIVTLGLLAVFAGSWLGSQNIALRSALRETTVPSTDNSSAVLRPGETLPDVGVARVSEDLAGPLEPASLHQHIQGPTVLFLFTSTCQFCQRSFPIAPTLQRELVELSVDLVGVSVDGILEGVGGIGEAARTYRAVALADALEARKLGVEAVPTFLLVDPDFGILQAWTGQLTESRVGEIVEAARGMGAPGE